MNEENNSRLSRTSENTSLQTITTTSTSQNLDLEDGSSARSTEDDTNLLCTSADAYKDSINDDRQPMFVIVESSYTSNPSSKEILINKRNTMKETTTKRNPRHNVIPVDTPCTSTDQTNFVLPHHQENDSIEELQMVDINLQSENEIEIDDVENETEPESIVIAYLRNKDAFTDSDGLNIPRKKSSLLENVPKMETIPENKLFSPFSNQLVDSSLESQHNTNAKNENNPD